MLDEILNLARSEIILMKPYYSARNENNQGKIWLDANENPWDDEYNRYPEPQPTLLISVLSDLYYVNKNQLMVTRGSDEGIDLLVRLFCRAQKDKMMICSPTYGMYKVSAAIQGAEVVDIPLIKDENFSLDTTKILENWQPPIKLIFLCSPNNPTGNSLSQVDILLMCKKLLGKAIVIVDEAYIEFSMSNSLANNLNEYPNLVILRTLSKAYGLAGVRCGVTLANEDIISLLQKIIAPYPISRPIIDIVIKKVKLNLVNDQVKKINEEKNKLYHFLLNLNYIKKVWKSDANFLLFEANNISNILTACKTHGVMLRDRSHEVNLENCIRVTIGNSRENNFLMEILSCLTK